MHLLLLIYERVANIKYRMIRLLRVNPVHPRVLCLLWCIPHKYGVLHFAVPLPVHPTLPPPLIYLLELKIPLSCTHTWLPRLILHVIINKAFLSAGQAI